MIGKVAFQRLFYFLEPFFSLIKEPHTGDLIFMWHSYIFFRNVIRLLIKDEHLAPPYDREMNIVLSIS
jgi:hypothetical protein